MQKGHWTTRDGLRLHYRDWPGGGAGLPVLCLHGLTRNGRDFERIAPALAPRRVIAPDMRGRGGSQYDTEPANYHPAQYVADVWDLLGHLGLERVVCLGTSLGGWMSALMAHERPAAVAAAILNDIGPELAPEGAARVGATAATAPDVDDWAAAVEQTRRIYAAVLPGLSDDDWLWYARTTYRETDDGRLTLNCDRKVGEAARAGLSGLRQDPWMLYDALLERPTLLLRGALSDILASDLVTRMRARYPRLHSVEIPNRGHAPLLDEPEAERAIKKFFASVD